MVLDGVPVAGLCVPGEVERGDLDVSLAGLCDHMLNVLDLLSFGWRSRSFCIFPEGDVGRFNA